MADAGTVRALALLGAVALATVIVILEWPSAPGSARAMAANVPAPTPVSQALPSPPLIDHSVVETTGVAEPPEMSGASIAAYAH